jgi:AcrR family transcriptional regulator
MELVPMTPESDSNPKDEKARRILTAVRRILAKKGYAKTTVALVAEEAGVSRGLLHYYFRNKEEMLARVFRDNIETSLGMVEEVFGRSGSGEDLARELTRALRRIMEEDPDFFQLFFEVMAVARWSRVVQAEWDSLYGRFRQALLAGLEEAAGKGIIRPSLPIGGLATLLTGLLDGMGFQLATEPELIGVEEVWQTLEQGMATLLT